MMHNNEATLRGTLLGLLLVLSLSGCIAPLNAAKMIPQIDYSAFKKGGRTIAIAPVKMNTAETTIRTELLITDASYRDALSESIRRAGIFRRVAQGQAGDCLLHTEILSQKVVPGLTANAIFFVRYELINNATKEKLWQDSILSQYDSYGGDLPNTVEGAVRDNITQLLTSLSALP